MVIFPSMNGYPYMYPSLNCTSVFPFICIGGTMNGRPFNVTRSLFTLFRFLIILSCVQYFRKIFCLLVVIFHPKLSSPIGIKMISCTSIFICLRNSLSSFCSEGFMFCICIYEIYPERGCLYNGEVISLVYMNLLSISKVLCRYLPLLLFQYSIGFCL